MALKLKKKNDPVKEHVSMKEYLDAEMELEKLRKEHGVVVEEKGLSRLISKFFNWREAKEKVSVNRKKYLWVTILLGWCGGHRFMAKQYVLGTIYLLLFWTGFPLAMTMIDLLVIIPIPPDENGNILV